MREEGESNRGRLRRPVAHRRPQEMASGGGGGGGHSGKTAEGDAETQTFPRSVEGRSGISLN